MNKLKISTRLTASFCVLLFLISTMAGMGLWLMHTTNGAINNLIEVRLKNERLINHWEKLLEVNMARTMAVAKTDDPAVAKYFQDAIGETTKEAADVIAALRANLVDQEAKDLFQTAFDNYGIFRDARVKALEAKNQGDTASVTQFFDHDMKGLADTYTQSFSGLLGYMTDKIAENTELIHESNALGRIVMLALTAIAIIIGMVLGYYIKQSITVPLVRAVKLAQAVSSRDLQQIIEPQGNDETGMLMQALKQMNDNLGSVVGELRRDADSIAMASSQIAAGNEDLSSRTEQQASSLAETAATMEQMTATVKQNADNAQQANTLSEAAAQVAIKGGNIVDEVVVTMASINESAKKIVEIISVIDGIAFQTNILALNAAVEAARAGEQGKGFAVVAAEVRALAQRSAMAAKEIKVLIDTSVTATETGNKLVAETRTTMNDIVTGVQRVTDIMGEITAASREQSTGIEQVNLAIAQMDQVTHQNASLVEEAAAAASSLQDQARGLAGIVGTFKIPDLAVARPVLLAM